MASFTIHSLDRELDIRLSEKAKRAGTSKNQVIKDILSRATGLPAPDGSSDDYGEFHGLWSLAELGEFNAAQTDNSRVDEREWLP
jgi:hypothetical protein